MIEFMIFCHNFQKRLSWVLSSLAQQIAPPEFAVQVASLRNNGTPTTEEVLAEFEHRFPVKHVVYDDKEGIARRGIIRNRQIELSTGEWFFFADADHVFHPYFLLTLGKYIGIDSIIKHRGCLTSDNKITTDATSTDHVIGQESGIYVNQAFERVQSIPMIDFPTRHIAGGCCQIVNRKTVEERTGGLYVNPKRCRDFHLFNYIQCARSDMQFRDKLARTKFLELPTMIHLNHTRDKVLGYHTEEQR